MAVVSWDVRCACWDKSDVVLEELGEEMQYLRESSYEFACVQEVSMRRSGDAIANAGMRHQRDRPQRHRYREAPLAGNHRGQQDGRKMDGHTAAAP